MDAPTHKAPRAVRVRLARLCLPIILFSFYLTAFARAAPSVNAALDARESEHPAFSDEKDQIGRKVISKRQPEKPMTWDEAVEKGKKLLELVEERAERSPPLPNGWDADAKIQQSYQTILEQTTNGIPDVLRSPLQRDGITTEKWQLLWIEEKNDKSFYKNFYRYDTDAQVGVIVANDIFHSKGAALPWSAVAFEIYKELPDADPKKLKYIYQVGITNVSTKPLIARAMGSGDHTRKEEIDCKEWYVFSDGNDSFRALIGSPNGRGTAHLLADNVGDTGKKRIKEVYVTTTGEESYAMKIVIEDRD